MINNLRYTDDEIAGILADNRIFAFVGASANTSRPSYFAMKYLLTKGYTIHPINPGQAGKKILGQTVYGALNDVPGPIDIVDIFRNSKAAYDITQDAIRLKNERGIKVVWMQLGVINEEAAQQAQAAGLKVIMNRCPKIEYGRLSGEIGWAGVNTNVITSLRPKLAAAGVQSHEIRRKN